MLTDVFYKLHSLVVQRAYASSLGGRLEEGIGKLSSGTGTETEQELISTIVEIAVPVAVLSVVLLSFYAGYILISSQGNPDKIKEGKDILTNAIIGFLVIILSVSILLIVSNTLGLNIYN